MTGRTPYYKVRKGRAYFELGAERAERVGMKASYPLGPAGRDAQRSALNLYWEWQDKAGQPIPDKQERFVKGSVAHWFSKFKATEKWKTKKPATVEEWEYAWGFIGPQFGDRLINTIGPIEVERFQMSLEERGEYHRWRVIKILRALFKAAVDYKVIDASPCKTLPNPQPKGRKAFWMAHEVKTLIETAQNAGYEAMALGIRLGWETLMSPGDVRTLWIDELYETSQGFHIETNRNKTDAEVIVAISDELGRDLKAYIAALPFELISGQAILRTVRDKAEYRSVRFTDEFAKIRRMAFGQGEKRKFMDLRRSGNIEAELGGASADDRAEILANTLHKDAGLDAIYTPPTVAKARKVAKQREVGRAILAQENRNDLLPRRNEREKG